MTGNHIPIITGPDGNATINPAVRLGLTFKAVAERDSHKMGVIRASKAYIAAVLGMEPTSGPSDDGKTAYEWGVQDSKGRDYVIWDWNGMGEILNEHSVWGDRQGLVEIFGDAYKPE